MQKKSIIVGSSKNICKNIHLKYNLQNRNILLYIMYACLQLVFPIAHLVFMSRMRRSKFDMASSNIAKERIVRKGVITH